MEASRSEHHHVGKLERGESHRFKTDLDDDFPSKIVRRTVKMSRWTGQTLVHSPCGT